MNKKSTKSEFILQWLSIIISVVGFIVLFVINQNTNKTLKEINEESNRKAVELKKYEINYKDKRDAYTDFRLTISNYHKEMMSYCTMTDLSWPVPRTKEQIVEYEKQEKEVNKYLNVLDEKAIKLYPYITSAERDSLKKYNDKLKSDTEKYFDYNMVIQGMGKNNTFNFYCFEAYLTFALKISDKFYSEF
jgi:hypothetical protein